MASKFQKRLVGTIVIVVVSFTVLPVLLDGNKKYNSSEFVGIPLLFKVSDEYKIEPIPPIHNHPLVTPKESIAPGIIAEAISDAKTKLTNHQLNQQSRKSKLIVQVENSFLVPHKATMLNKKSKIPKAQAYIIQLGVLKNAKKVEEIIAKLRLSGYHVYTEPSVPIHGQLTKIFIGPHVSREKLQSSLQELEDLTGLQGQTQSYKP
ncbi:MAG: SPOR domain-containing protein [Candidatus Arsenophonus melophagi]|nr:SPOR domain-containing protein [Candidatus Arsenophonus melophagi]